MDPVVYSGEQSEDEVRDTELQTKGGQDTPSFRPCTRDQVPEPSPAGRHLRDAQVRVNAQNEK